MLAPSLALIRCNISLMTWLALFLALTTTLAAQPAGQPIGRRTMTAHGLDRPAEILIDPWGVPHIYAKSTPDAYFAQGFNAARDRLFQIDLWRRRGLGQLAEVLGPAYLAQDQASRHFLYRGDMAKEWAVYGPDAQMVATKFAAGINAYIDQLADQLPFEFKQLNYRPAKWDPADVVRIRSHGLTRNVSSEVARANTVCKTDAATGPKLDQLRFGLQPPWDTKVPDGLDPCLPKDVLKVFTLASQGVNFGPTAAAGPSENADGSNNWTIAPKKSSTGRPILGGDPHRAYSTPSLRYIAHLNAPGLNLIGAGEPSLPGVSMGHNGTIAFGLTIFNIDQEDLYVYELNPANPRQYRYQGAWEAMRVVTETVAVKGAAAVSTEMLFTRHGPVIYTEPAKKRAFALRTCWLEPGMAPYFGSAGFVKAKNFQQFQTAAHHWGAPTVNQVYADTKGNIGWVASGLTPVRRNWDGLMPVPGDGRYEWDGFWPGDKLPSVANPDSGYFTTSNEMNLPADYPYQERKLGFEWTNGSRHARLEEMFRALPKVSLEDSMRMQFDQTSIPARRLIALLAPLRSDDPQTQAALDLLRNWDAVERPDSAPAALYEVWLARHLNRAFLASALPQPGLIATVDRAVLLDTLEKQKPAALLLTSLTAAYSEMERLGGPDPKAWQWGKLHQSLPRHPLSGIVDAATRAKIQPGPFPAPGGPFSPLQSTYNANFQLTNGPSFRMVLDVGAWDNSRAVNYPGQSGNPDDPNYQNLTKLWLTGQYFPLLYTKAAVQKAAVTRILLQP